MAPPELVVAARRSRLPRSQKLKRMQTSQVAFAVSAFLLVCLVCYNLTQVDVRTFPGMRGWLYEIKLCSQEERITYLKKACKNDYRLAKKELLKPSNRSLVDLRHKLNLCWMSKAGCTSLKAFLLEAKGFNFIKNPNKEDSLSMVHGVSTMNSYDLYLMAQFNDIDQARIVNTFFNAMTIRHPFDRLVSYYRDKILDRDRTSIHPARVAAILRDVRGELFQQNKTLNQMRRPQEVIGLPTFSEFITWIYHHKVKDEHWNLIYEVCHPCAHDWSAILRIETLITDGRLVAKQVNSSRTELPVRHSHQNTTNDLHFWKTLPEFSTVPDEIIDYLLEFYRTDMTMFGYRWTKRTNTAVCAIRTADGWCC